MQTLYYVKLILYHKTPKRLAVVAVAAQLQHSTVGVWTMVLPLAFRQSIPPNLPLRLSTTAQYVPAQEIGSTGLG